MSAHISSVPFDLRWETPQVATAQTKTATITETHTHTRSTWKECKETWEKSYFSAVRSIILTTNTFHIQTLKQTIISRKMQTLFNSGASKHCAATTFETKKASKQVNRQDTLFTISCSLSAEEFDLFLLYIPQCHKHSAVSLCFKGPSVTGSEGKDQIFISKTQNGKF